MNEHFLTYINIEQFKCFHNFSASGFKRVNLISGKNNIGKTAFLEAGFINVNAKGFKELFSTISTVKFLRETLNISTNMKRGLRVENLSREFLMAAREYIVESNLHSQRFQISENIEREYIVKIQSKVVPKEPLEAVVSNQQLIHSTTPPPLPKEFSLMVHHYGFDNEELAYIFQFIQKNDQEAELNRLLHEFDQDIESFKMIGEQPQCKINGKYLDLTELGSGFAHYISIICALHACQNRHLFIDELGNGIHYSQLDRLWEVILTISKRVQGQVFATTHSKEMLESFARVAKRLNEQDISYTTLVKNKQQEIKALTLDYELLQDSLAQDHEIR